MGAPVLASRCDRCLLLLSEPPSICDQWKSAHLFLSGTLIPHPPSEHAPERREGGDSSQSTVHGSNQLGAEFGCVNCPLLSMMVQLRLRLEKMGPGKENSPPLVPLRRAAPRIALRGTRCILARYARRCAGRASPSFLMTSLVSTPGWECPNGLATYSTVLSLSALAMRYFIFFMLLPRPR